MALVAVAVIVVGIDACGGSSDEVVAKVAGIGSISKAALDHWMQVEASLLYAVIPTRPVPKGVIPDPPTYTACIAYLHSIRQTITETGPKPTPRQLKNKCAQQYHSLKELTLSKLITWDWTIGNAAAEGMKVSDAEVHKRFESIKANYFPRLTELHNYLRWSRQTVGDMLLRAKIQLIEVKFQERIQHLVAKSPRSHQPQALAKLVVSWPTPAQWTARTSCRKGYVTSGCKQYHRAPSSGTPK
jgi:foldase protein PrsA